MNKIIITSLVVVLSTFAFAQRRGNVRKGTDVPRQSATANKILLEQLPKTGMSSCLSAPRIDGPSQIGQCYMKPRRWIVCETKYKTFAKFIDQLTFTWHVLLESKTATENKGNKEGLAPYSYFSTTVNYFNIPNGSHAACVCLPPSYLELYGEPRAIGFVISNKDGEVLAGDTVSEIKGIKSGTMFWEDQNIMGAVDKAGKPLIERRQGLLDRSKTIWALVNPNDYETTLVQ